MKIILIAAKAKNNCIGVQNTIPWYLPSDLQHFKNTTMGAPMLMGARTWESFGCRALPGRDHIVVSSRPPLNVREKDMERVHHRETIDTALDLGSYIAKAKNTNLYVIGGANVYEQMINTVDELILTEIEREYPGDRFFPEINPTIWEVGVTHIPSDPEHPYRIVTYVRK